MRRRIPALAVLAVAAVTVLGGCSGGEFGGVYDLPLPGGADLGDHPYEVHIEFKDVLDLVPQAGVKVNDVAIGKVARVGLGPDGWTADVTVEVNGDVKLPANASAQLRQSSLLGEKYVELVAPNNPTGRLAGGATIPLDRTNRNPEVEEVFGALSLLLNGGGIGQIQDISKELNSALSGNEPQIRQLLTNLNTVVSNLDAHRNDITRALDGLNRLSGTLNTQRDELAGAIDNLGPGLAVLTQQRDQLVTMLNSLSSLSGVAVDTVNKSQADLIADLKDLQPALTQLAASGQNLPKSLQLLLTFPFPDATVAGVKGDYTNLYADLDLNLGDVVSNLGRSRQSLLPSIPGLTGGSGNGVPLPLPTPPGGSSSGGLGGLLGGLLGGGGH
ncbi:MCE family protein [Kutzneria sp. 744]|uniref:MCE family protein n=1 Tax=Kutzneria sp. (strain 744) TaxID=345341 RepID=UPI0003EEDD0F|nr:MCE family protein [Kutzneria sp. 744]EWM15532.1 ABC transporter substrate-binding protein [Kutzneria sp. 744]